MNDLSPKKRILLVFNSATGQPGRLGTVMRQYGFEFDIRRPGEGDPLPTDLGKYHLVVVFGGPMSANDDHLDNVRAIMNWLPHVVDSDAMYLGICLGAQMMARHFGADVLPHPDGMTEIGYYPVQATEAGQHLFPEEMVVYHWHSEGFGLPEGAELVATGPTFPHQAYHIDERIWGIQFHPEVDDEAHERWLSNAADKTDRPNAQCPDTQRAGREKYDAAFGAWFERFAKQVLVKNQVSCDVGQSS
ncbi:GMP synthase [Thalassospira sp. HF15]|uniref:glutamine amidotransferase-related protein n=1 Tax=Thalassospira sp. HF15 TaxID=2722755 RepID=UPI001430523E|nr:GMP synthase [Thalassospira sp. HF15]NIY75365.1 GMP synthase [Thalassospira sp. HF15]